MVTLIAEQVRQQNATAAAAAAADAAAIVPSFCVACSAHTHAYSCTLSHTRTHEAQFSFRYFYSLMNWLIFFFAYIFVIPFHCVSTAFEQNQRNSHSMHIFHFICFNKRLRHRRQQRQQQSLRRQRRLLAGDFLGVEIILHALIL